MHDVALRPRRLLDGRVESLEELEERHPEVQLKIRLRTRGDGRLVMDRPAHHLGGIAVVAAGEEDAVQVPARGFPGHGGGEVGRRQRQQAAVAGETPLVLAGTFRQDLPGPVQQAPHPMRVGEFGEIAGSSGHQIVQQQRVHGARAVGPRGLDHLDADMAGAAAELVAQSHQNCRLQAGQRELVAGGHRPGQGDEGALGPQRAGQADQLGRARRSHADGGTTGGVRRRSSLVPIGRGGRSPRRPGRAASAADAPRSTGPVRGWLGARCSANAG